MAVETREEQILGIAARLFGTDGFERTSLRDIAEAAGITKAALYYYFPDKEALYDRVVLDGLEQLHAYVFAQMDAADSCKGRLNAFVLATAEYLERERFSWLAGSNAFWAEHDRKRRVRAIDYRDRFERLLRDAIQALIASGEWRPVDAALAARFILGAINQIPRWHSPDGPLTVVQVAEHYLDFTLAGFEQR
jgi:AcrR family transcriptional regulator